MAAKAEKTTTGTMSERPAYERKKLSVQYIDLADLKEAGETFIGTYLGQQSGEWVDKNNGGEVKNLVRLIFDRRNPATMESMGRVVVFQNKGLEKSLQDALVSVGDTIEIDHLGKTDLAGGRTVNQYDVFAVEHPKLQGVKAQALKQAASITPPPSQL